MKSTLLIPKIAIYLALATSPMLHAQAPTAPEATQPIVDPAAVAWPRTFSAGSQDFALFQPQISTWTGNQISGSFAVGVRATGSQDESYGTVSFTSRTEIDKPNRLATLENFTLGTVSFPTTPDKDAAYQAILTENIPQAAKTIPLDHLESVFVVSGEAEKHLEVAVKNEPPRIIYTTQPSVLILIDGAPVLKPLDSVYQRVINTSSVLLLNTINSKFYAFAGGGWFNAPSVEGPFATDPNPPADIQEALKLAIATNKVDPMEPAEGAPPVLSLYTSTTAAELVQTTGLANIVPVENASNLLYITNTDNALFIDADTNFYYVLISGRWFSSLSLYGPWQFIPNGSLPLNFQKIPTDHPKSNVLASVAGTPQAREAVIASNIPQTATIDRSKATLTINYTGEAAFAPIDGTQLAYATNTQTPVVQVNANSYYANEGGLWFAASSPTGPWEAATAVPAAIYTIPPSSPIYYVTSCYVYGCTPETIYTGYTPGYTGTVVATGGVVVNGTGYVYPPVIIDSTWIGYPPTYGYGWGMAVGAFTGFAYGYAAGAAFDCWAHPYWGGYGCGWGAGYSHVNVNSTNFYSHWGTAVHATSTRGYNAWTGNAWAGQHASTFNPYSGARAAGSRGAVANPYTGNYAAGRQGAGYNPSTGRFAAGQQGIAGNAYHGNLSSVNRGVAGNVKTGNAVAWNNGNVYTDHQGNIHSNTDSGNFNRWDHSSYGNHTNNWSSQSFGRSMGDQRSDAFRSNGGGGWGRSFGGGGRFGGGRGFGGRR